MKLGKTTQNFNPKQPHDTKQIVNTNINLMHKSHTHININISNDNDLNKLRQLQLQNQLLENNKYRDVSYVKQKALKGLNTRAKSSASTRMQFMDIPLVPTRTE